MKVLPSDIENSEVSSQRQIIYLPSCAQVANLSKAQEYKNQTGIRTFDQASNQYKPYPICSTSESVLGQYGVGLELYFLFIRTASFLFLAIGLISVYPMYSNYSGYEFGSTNQNNRYTYFTLANQAGISKYETNITYAQSQLPQISQSYNTLWAIDFSTCLFFIIFILYYLKKSRAKVRDIVGKHYRVSDFAVQIEGFPPFITEDHVSAQFLEFGEVEEIYLSRDYEGKLSNYKKIFERGYEIEVGQLTGHNRSSSNNSIVSKYIKESKDALDRNHDELYVDKVFVVFNTLEAKRKCLRFYKDNRISFNCLKKKKGVQGRRTANFRLVVQPAPNSSDIIWENMAYGYFSVLKRRVFISFLTVLIIVISFIVVFAIKGYLKSSITNTECRSENVLGNLDINTASVLYSKETEMNCYCLQQSINSILFSKAYQEFCSKYIQSITNLSFIRLAISSFIAVINIVLKLIINYLSKFERYKSKSEKRKAILIKMFILSFVNIALTTFLCTTQLNENVSILNGKYSDITRDWYDDVGSTITITMIVHIFSPHVFNALFIWPLDLLRHKFCYKRFSSQLKLNKFFRGPSFNISDSLSQVLVVIYTNFFNSSGIPFLNILCLFTLILTYWSNKVLILRYYRKPPEYNYEINNIILIYLPGAIIVHSVFGIYAFGSSEIFPSGVSKLDSSTYIEFDNVSFKDRIISNSGIAFMVLIAVSIMLTIYIKISNDSFSQGFWNEKNQSGSNEVLLKDLKEKKILVGLESYDIRKNPKYMSFVKTLDKIAVKKQELASGFVEDNNSSESIQNDIDEESLNNS